MPIPVIDLFAGPGGLGEGFSSILNENAERIFKIKLSIEKDPIAHKTLELRAFFREFSINKAPDEYYDYLRGKITREELFTKFPDEAKQAADEAWRATLGKMQIRKVDERIKLALGGIDDWLLIGGPPCQAYSLLGRWRQGKEDENFESDRRHFLYRQYLRILAVHQPPVFVMENVKGLLSATVKKERIFDNIREDLRHPFAAKRFGTNEDLEYNLFPLTPTGNEESGKFEPEDFVLRAEQFGIPQARHRIIIVGVRSGWPHKPDLLQSSDNTVLIEDVIGSLPKLRSGLSKEPDSADNWKKAIHEISNFKWLTNDEITAELRRELIDAIGKVTAGLNRGDKFLQANAKPKKLSMWFWDSRLNGVCNHETRSHIRADLHRYFFAAVFAKEFARSTVLENFPKELLPLHKNVNDSKFSDRFRVQLAGRPSTTIVSHIAKDGHYYIHYDPSQCRSLTVREAARLQTFPDNYFFEGPRTEQYHQVGNAVPPLLAKQIAEIVAGLFD
jgi:DNA (cytosine-5)-methyltransferase 1